MQNLVDTSYTKISQRLTAFFCAVVIILESGCATPQLPQNTKYQNTLGKIAVVATSHEPEVKLEGFLHGKDEGAASGAGKTFSSCLSGAAQSHDGLFFAFALVVCGVAAPVGAIVGAAQTSSSEEVKISEDAISTALAVKTIQEKLREQIVAAALSNGASLVTVSPEYLQDAARLQNYHSVMDAGVDTVLEVTVTRLGTEAGGGGINPPLLFTMTAHVRLIRSSDNAEMFSHDYVYLGEILDLSEWSANQAERLTHDLQVGYETLGQHIYDSIFLLYPYPDRENHNVPGGVMNGFAFGLLPIYPLTRTVIGQPCGNRNLLAGDAWLKSDSLQPTFRWQSFPRASDIHLAPDEMGRVKNVSYDLIVAREHNFAHAEVVYRRKGLSDTFHTINTTLSSSTCYFWTVRARFELDGHERVTEWGMSQWGFVQPMERWTSPSNFSYRFMTP